jgi:CHAT domain-containing protein
MRALPDRGLLVEYFLGEDRSFVWKIDRHGMRVSELPPRNQIELQARRLVDLVSRVEERKADAGKQTELDHICRELAATLQLSFADKQGPERLVIVPDGILNRVPFAVLRVKAGGGARGAGLPLGLICELLQAPSATAWRILQERGWKPPDQPISVAAFVDPVFDSWDPRVESGRPAAAGPGPAPAGMSLARLPFSSIEIESLRRLPPERQLVLRGFEATRTALFSPRIQSFPILFLSTHAYADDLQPELSSLAMTAVTKDGKPADGLVRVYDLLGRHWNAFVVLSGCETGSGREVDGEGLIGLSRGFLEAGATGLLAASQRVDAEGSAFLMKEFFGALLRTGAAITPSAALLHARRALALSARWKDPYFWGSFFLISGS